MSVSTDFLLIRKGGINYGKHGKKANERKVINYYDAYGHFLLYEYITLQLCSPSHKQRISAHQFISKLGYFGLYPYLWYWNSDLWEISRSV